MKLWRWPKAQVWLITEEGDDSLTWSFYCISSCSVSVVCRQEAVSGCRVVWLQSGCLAGRMPVAPLMTLFSSGVQGVGVSGWTLPDGTKPTTVCGKENKSTKTAPTENTNWSTFMATQTQKKIENQSRCQVGLYNLTMMIVTRKIWQYLDCGLFEFWNIIDERSVWALDHGLNYTKWNCNLKFKPCSWQADRQQAHNMKFLSRTAT